MSEIVKFTGDNAELFCRESADDLHASAQVIVPETHTVLLIKDGVVSEALAPGKHKIFDTENGLFGPKKDSEVSSVDFVFISKTAKLPMLWGTSTPIKTRDPETGVPITLGMNGELEFRVKTPKQFYLELVGVDQEYSVSKLKKRLLGRLVSVIEPIVTSVMRDGQMSYADFSHNKSAVSDKIKAKLDEFFDGEYGLELCSFSVSGAFIPDADILAVERKRDELRSVKRTCGACGAQVLFDAKFCHICGAALGDGLCSHCGKQLADGAKFCSYCGKKVK